MDHLGVRRAWRWVIQASCSVRVPCARVFCALAMSMVVSSDNRKNVNKKEKNIFIYLFVRGYFLYKLTGTIDGLKASQRRPMNRAAHLLSSSAGRSKRPPGDEPSNRSIRPPNKYLSSNLPAEQFSKVGLSSNLPAEQPSSAGLSTNLSAEQPSKASLPRNPAK
jgi:hypothetical protein